MRTGLLGFALAVTACSNKALSTKSFEFSGTITDSSCANPAIIAIEAEHVQALNLPTEKTVTLSDVELVRGLFLPKGRGLATQVYAPDDCSDQSIKQLYQQDYWSPSPRPAGALPISFYLKIIDLEKSKINVDYRCSEEIFLNIAPNVTQDKEIKYRICRYTNKKIAAGELIVTPIKECLYGENVNLRSCFEKMMSERRRIVDLSKLNLLPKMNKVEMQTIIVNLGITERGVEIYKFMRSDEILTEKTKCIITIEEESCELARQRKRNSRNFTASNESTRLLSLTIQAQQALLESLI